MNTEFDHPTSGSARGPLTTREGEAPAEPHLCFADESTLAAQQELRPPVTARGLENGFSDRRKGLRAAALLVIALAVTMSGCTKHPQVSFDNRHYAAALRTACSAKDAGMLAKAKLVIERDHSAGSISSEEVESYREIIQAAEAGAWQDAERECHRFQKDQLAK